MQELSSEVISLSSDDEVEAPPLKKSKASSDTEDSLKSKEDALRKLHHLKEISTFTENGEEQTRIKNHKEENSLTIIIESDGKDSNVVVIDEDRSSDENPNNSSTIIIDDHSESEDVENNKTNILDISNGSEVTTKKESNNVIDRPSTSKASETQKLFDEFLDTCVCSIRNSKYETQLLNKFSKIKKYFASCENLHDDISLKKMLQDYIETAKCSAADAVICFQRTFSYFLEHTRGSNIEVSKDDLPKIKKLEKMCKLLVKKLKQLEESELNFDDENDSTYIQMERYSQRLNKVYNKYCQLINKNPHSGRLTYEKINFVSSKYDDINRAITKFCKHNKFPTYYDIEKCIQKCINKNNLSLTEREILTESENCFKHLGTLMQSRRKKELYDIHCDFIALNEDPANKDPELKVKLQESLNEGEKRMKEVVEKYVRLQEHNVNPEVSEDSDDSNYQSSESED